MHTTSGGRGRMAIHIRRRKFLATLGGAAAAWPLAARAQQLAMPVIGILFGGSQQAGRFRLAAIQRGLNATGFVEGQNVAFEYRSAEGRYERLPQPARLQCRNWIVHALA